MKAALCVLFLSACGLLGQPLEVPSDPTRPVLNATVRVGNSVDGFNCSGVLHRGLVLTAKHCLRREEADFFVSLRSAEESRIPASMLTELPDQDLAVLRASDRLLPDGIDVGDGSPGYGQGIAVVGHPKGLNWTMTTGIVAHPRRVGGFLPEMVWMQISAPVAPGSSGGPVVDSDGDLVGIVLFHIPGQPSLVGVSHLDSIHSLVDTILSSE